MPKKKKEEIEEEKEEKVEAPKKEGGVFVSEKTGRPSGVELPDGRTFFGLSPEDVAKIQGKEAPEGLPLISERGKERKEIISEPEKFGLERPTEEIVPKVQPSTIPEQLRQAGEGSFIGEKVNPALASVVEFLGGELQMDETGRLQVTEEGVKTLARNAVITGAITGIGAGLLGKIGWKVKGVIGTFTNPQKAVQIATAAKNAFMAKTTFEKLAIIGAGYYAVEKGISLTEGLINRKVDEQQQGLNTLGQITSSIVGDSTTGAGDARKGLEELRYIRSEILKLESDIKKGTISEILLKTSGKVIDINADIYDQLATVDEGIRDIQTFILTGQFPELSEYEMQQLIRELEAEGYIEEVDLTTARRPT